jgi:uncharacterized membrane protein
MDLETLGGRRFLLVFCTSIATTLLTWFTKIDGSTYSLVTLGICGAYITGNTIQKIKTPVLETSMEVKSNESNK